MAHKLREPDWVRSFKMAHRIPIQQDDLSFEERQSKVWEDMEKDMERRRKEWEDEIENMRGGFFNLRPSSNGKIEALSDKLGSSEDAKTVIEKDQFGRPVFRVRFNVSDYKPEEVNVKMDAQKLIVNAKHEQKDGQRSVSREYSREINIPNEIDPMALHCTISSDGVLTAEALMPVPNYAPITDSPGGQRVVQNVSSSMSSTPPRVTPPIGVQVQNMPPTTHTSTFTTFMSPKSGTSSPPQPPYPGPPTGSTHVTNTNNLQRTYSAPPSHVTSSSSTSKYETRSGSQSPATMDRGDKRFRVEIDIEDFNPEDLNVKTVDKKLVISARKEERIGARTSTKELNREFSLPDTVDPMSIKAFFSDSGKLLVEAPCVRPIAVGHYSDGREGSPHFGMGSPLSGR
ncbi:major egg antigen-like isoform X1 [Crassostrea virginica]